MKWVSEDDRRVVEWRSGDNGRDGVHRPGNVERCCRSPLPLLPSLLLLLLLGQIMWWRPGAALVLCVLISRLRCLSHGHLLHTHQTIPAQIPPYFAFSVCVSSVPFASLSAPLFLVGKVHQVRLPCF